MDVACGWIKMLNHLSPFSRGTGGFFCIWRLTVHRRLPPSALQCGKSSTVRTRRSTNLSLPCRAGFNQTQIWLRRDTGIRVTRRNCLVDCARFMSQRVTRAGFSGGMELQKWPRHDHKDDDDDVPGRSQRTTACAIKIQQLSSSFTQNAPPFQGGSVHTTCWAVGAAGIYGTGRSGGFAT